MIKRLFALGLAIGAVSTAIPAHAEPPITEDMGDCAKRAQVVERLRQDYSETLTAGGLTSAAADGAIVEVWASPRTGTFTVMTTDAHGISCILATGTEFFAAESAIRPVGIEG